MKNARPYPPPVKGVDVSDFFRAAFGKAPESDPSYFDEWVERWYKGPEDFMSSSTKAAFDKLATKKNADGLSLSDVEASYDQLTEPTRSMILKKQGCSEQDGKKAFAQLSAGDQDKVAKTWKLKNSSPDSAQPLWENGDPALRTAWLQASGQDLNEVSKLWSELSPDTRTALEQEMSAADAGAERANAMKNSYGDYSIKEDLRSGMQVIDVVEKICEHYPDITSDQARTIVKRIQKGENGGWDKLNAAYPHLKDWWDQADQAQREGLLEDAGFPREYSTKEFGFLSEGIKSKLDGMRDSLNSVKSNAIVLQNSSSIGIQRGAQKYGTLQNAKEVAYKGYVLTTEPNQFKPGEFRCLILTAPDRRATFLRSASHTTEDSAIAEGKRRVETGEGLILR